MADKKIVNLTAVTTPTSEDLAILVTDAATAPNNKKSTLATFFNKIPTWLGLSTTPVVFTSGAIDITTPVSFLSVTGTVAFSLAAGITGQIKMLVCTVAASTPVGVLTPVASANDGYNTITFDKVGQSVTLIYENSGWIMLSGNRVSNFSSGFDFTDGFRAGNADLIINEDDTYGAIRAEDDSFRIALQDTIPSNFASNKSLADATDIVFNQFDETEVARIHDGAVEPTQGGTTPVFSAGTGFGYRRRILTLGSANDDNTLTLTAADSGSIIYVTPTNAVTLILPLVGTDTGIWFDVIIAANVNKAFLIKTSRQTGVDNITLYSAASDAVAADVGGTDHDILTFTNSLIGSRIELINCVGQAAEEWHAYVRSMSTIDASIA